MNNVQYEKLVKIPPLTEDLGSLTAAEKSILAHFILLVRPRIILELGVFHAVTTQFMCEFLMKNGLDGRVIGFDVPEVVAALRENNPSVQHLEALQRLQLVPGRLPFSLSAWLNSTTDQFDFALVDATHDYHNVYGELTTLWPHLSADGFILCHDYSVKYDGVRYAVDEFAARNGAACMPLLSSNAAGKAGYSSCLVALRHRPHRLTVAGIVPHWWMSTKIRLLANPVFGQLWNYVRSFLDKID